MGVCLSDYVIILLNGRTRSRLGGTWKIGGGVTKQIQHHLPSVAWVKMS